MKVKFVKKVDILSLVKELLLRTRDFCEKRGSLLFFMIRLLDE